MEIMFQSNQYFLIKKKTLLPTRKEVLSGFGLLLWLAVWLPSFFLLLDGDRGLPRIDGRIGAPGVVVLLCLCLGRK